MNKTVKKISFTALFAAMAYAHSYDKAMEHNES